MADLNVMVLDDDTELARLLEGVLASDDLFVVLFQDPAEAVAAAVTGPWLAALVSMDLPENAGEVFLEVLEDLEHVQVPVVLTSAEYREQSDKIKAVKERFGLSLFLRKPIPLLDLTDMLRKSLKGGTGLLALPALGSNGSISVDLGLSDTNEVEFEPAPASASVTKEEPALRGRSSLKGVLGGLERGRKGVEELVELGDSDLVPVSVAPEELQVVAPEGSSYALEIEDEDSEELSFEG